MSGQAAGNWVSRAGYECGISNWVKRAIIVARGAHYRVFRDEIGENRRREGGGHKKTAGPQVDARRHN